MTFTDDKLQSQRFEMKYIIEERVALSIRDFIRSYLDVDAFGATCPNLSYPVHSLYLDSPDLCLYHSTINGDKNRFKMRLRYYENGASSPIYFEIKRRMNNTIAKQRGKVRREAVRDLLSGFSPEPAHMASPEPKQLAAVEHFCRLMGELRAEPRTHVAYLREAWVSREDNSVRVTVDRQVCTETEDGLNFSTDMVRPVGVFGSLAVLELKFTGRFPDWFGELVRIFNLTQCGAAKYADGITRLGARATVRSFALNAAGQEAAEKRLERIDRSGVRSQNGHAYPTGMETVFAK